MDPVDEARALLLRVLELERDRELLVERRRAGEIDEEEVERILDARDDTYESLRWTHPNRGATERDGTSSARRVRRLRISPIVITQIARS